MANTGKYKDIVIVKDWHRGKDKKHGRWENFIYNAPDGLVYPVMKCSCCGLIVSQAFAEESNYCKDCGAKMEEVTKDV